MKLRLIYSNNKLIQPLSLLGIIILFVLLRWNSFNAPFERDEGGYAYIAWMLKKGQLPYKDIFDIKPPLIYYTYFVAQLIHPEAYWPPRLLASVSVFLTTLLLGYIAKKEFGKNSGNIVMWLVTPMFVLPTLLPFAANTEVFMLLPLIGCLAIYVKHRKDSRSIHWFLFGVLSGISILYKPLGLFVLFLIFSMWHVEAWKIERSFPILLKRISFSILGSIFISLLIMAPFLISDWGKDFWNTVVIYGVEYYGVRNNWNPLFYNCKLFFSCWPLLFLLTLYYIAKVGIKGKLLYVLLIIISLLTVGRSEIGHYYLLFIPFWSLMVTEAVEYLFNEKFIVNKLSKNRNIAKFIFVLLLMYSLIFPVKQQFKIPPRDFNTWVYGKYEPFYETTIVANKVKKITKSNDLVWIAGSEPEILYYAKRKSASKFIYAYPLLIDTPFRESLQNELLQDINEKLPEVVVYFPEHWAYYNYKAAGLVEYFNDLFKRKYELVGGYVGRGHEGHWEEPLGAVSIPESTILVYKKI